MKTPANSQRETAVALIIVLAMLLLLSGLIVSFMTTVGNERAASFTNNNGVTTRQLADSTVNLVIGQIRQATTQAEAASVPTTWASQPGAIRTFSGTVDRSKPVTIGAAGVNQWTYRPGTNDYTFKLFSSERMKIPASDLTNQVWDPQDISVIEKWDWTLSESEREKAGFRGYVDLNEPIISALPDSVTKGDATIVQPRYPILDPRAKFLANETLNSTPEPGIVDGFDVKTTGLSDKHLTTAAKKAVQYLPMPVKWIYVMRDGSMAAADNTTGKIKGASLENPIVGRTAFWTDDESCKLNINTHSQGTFWDTPTASCEQISGNVDGAGALTSTNTSLNLGASQPVRGEFQRYPGHPATTSLSPALGWMWGLLPTQAARPTRDTTLVNFKEAMVQLSPFTPNGRGAVGLGSTSMAASYNPDPDMPAGGDQIPQLNVTTKHLYTTVDELVFKQDRNTGSLTTPTKLNNDKLTPENLEKVRFFLTTNSRSPQLNLFGRPRVTFWPVNTKLELRTGFDDLFAFTSTLYKDPSGNRDRDNVFYFTRYDARIQDNDFKNNIVGQPRNRNQDIYKYLQLMTGEGSAFRSIPGFGGSFATKYPDVTGSGYSERNQILMEIFDYCRSINLVDTSKRNRAGAYQPYTPFFGEGSGYLDFPTRTADWSGLVVPTVTPPTPGAVANLQGLGRFPMISEAAIVLYRTGAKRQDGYYDKIQAALLFEMTTAMPGYPALRETFHTRVTQERPTTLAFDVPNQPAGAEQDIYLVGGLGNLPRWNIVNVSSHDVGYGRSFMPTLGFMNQLHYYNPEPAAPTPEVVNPPLTGTCTPKIFGWEDPNGQSNTDATFKYGRPNKTIRYYPYVSLPITVPATENANNKMKFRGGAYKVEIFSGEAPDDPRTRLVQTVHIAFPNNQVTVTIPKGKLNVDVSFKNRLDGRQRMLDTTWDVFNPRGNTVNGLNLEGVEDFIRSVEYVGVTRTGDNNAPWATLSGNQRGDFRLGQCMRELPAEAYQPRGRGLTDYNSGNLRIHGLQISHGEPLSYYFGNANGAASATSPAMGLLAKDGRNRDRKPQILPVDVNGVERADGGVGDWDRGLSKHVDGAFGGKVDEGNVWFNYDDVNDGSRVPYFRGRGIEETGRSFFTPNRQVASAVMFGSLPTGVVRGKPWQTLLFRPDRGTKPHPGAQSSSYPADHLLLDLFNLPIVEPYAISEPFSTGGQVNLNYVIAPFGYAKGDTGTRAGIAMARSYLRRDTALRGVFDAVKMMAVLTSQPQAAHNDGPTGTTTQLYFDINSEKTLDQFESRLKDPERGLFRSASEICDMDLYPGGSGAPTVSNWTTFWENTYAQTGDNMRERPYATIYPRVTTKSNVYTIHMRCQAVKKVPGTSPDEFDPKRDKVLAEYRGSATIERFIDPNDPQLATYDATSGESSVDPFYRFRVISTKQFLPR